MLQQQITDMYLFQEEEEVPTSRLAMLGEVDVAVVMLALKISNNCQLQSPALHLRPSGRSYRKP